MNTPQGKKQSNTLGDTSGITLSDIFIGEPPRGNGNTIGDGL